MRDTNVLAVVRKCPGGYWGLGGFVVVADMEPGAAVHLSTSGS